MTTLRELLELMPDVFHHVLTPESTSGSRLAPWLEAARCTHIGNLETVCTWFRFGKGNLFPDPMDRRTRRALAALLDANRHPLDLLADSSKMHSFVALPIHLDDCDYYSAEDYALLEAHLPALLCLQYCNARHLISLDRHLDALQQVKEIVQTSKRLFASATVGEVNQEGFFRLHGACLAAIELAHDVHVDQDAIVASLISEMERCRMPAVDFARMQMLYFCAGVLLAVAECPNTRDVSELLRYFHNSAELRTILGRNWQLCDEECTSTKAANGRYEDDLSEVSAEQRCCVARGLLDGHPSLFRKAETLAELCEILALPWTHLDKAPHEVREFGSEIRDAEFLPGMDNGCATVIAGGRYFDANTWREVEAGAATARQLLSHIGNPVGNAICFELKRVLLHDFIQTLGSWYYLRRVQEVTLSLLGVKAFALRMNRRPNNMVDLVDSGILKDVPQDPYSQTALQYLPEREIVRVDPANDESEEWEVDPTAIQTWHALRM